jgi:hypothetical protein
MMVWTNPTSVRIRSPHPTVLARGEAAALRTGELTVPSCEPMDEPARQSPCCSDTKGQIRAG